MANEQHTPPRGMRRGSANEPLLPTRPSINNEKDEVRGAVARYLAASSAEADKRHDMAGTISHTTSGGVGRRRGGAGGGGGGTKKKSSCFDSDRCYTCEASCCCTGRKGCCQGTCSTHTRGLLWEILSVRASKYGSYTTFWPSRIFEFFILALILANVVMVIFFAYNSAQKGADKEVGYQAFELASGIIFTIEYCLRLWSCIEDSRYKRPLVGRLRWMIKPLSLLDLICIIPYYLDFILITMHTRGLTVINVLRVVKVFSFLRMERQSKAFKRLARVFKKRQYELIVTVFVAATLFLVSSTIMFYLEPTTFPTVADAMWWSINTLTSVGYGDALPSTAAGKVLSGILAFLGIGLFALPAGILGSGFVEIMYDELAGDDSELGGEENDADDVEKGLSPYSRRPSSTRPDVREGNIRGEGVGQHGRVQSGEELHNRASDFHDTLPLESQPGVRTVSPSASRPKLHEVAGYPPRRPTERHRRNSDPTLSEGGGHHISGAMQMARDFVRHKEEKKHRDELLHTLSVSRRSSAVSEKEGQPRIRADSGRPSTAHGGRLNLLESTSEVECPHCQHVIAVQLDFLLRPSLAKGGRR